MLTGEPDAGDPHVRFGGRGGANQCVVPTPIFRLLDRVPSSRVIRRRSHVPAHRAGLQKNVLWVGDSCSRGRTAKRVSASKSEAKPQSRRQADKPRILWAGQCRRCHVPAYRVGGLRTTKLQMDVWMTRCVHLHFESVRLAFRVSNNARIAMAVP